MKVLWNTGWSFLKTELGTGIEEAESRAGEFMPVELPHDWLIYDAERLYEDSAGWYRKDMVWETEEEKRVFLLFDGIYMDSTVYVNGRWAGEWKYGYSAFEIEMTEHLTRGENQIMVRARFQRPNSRWYSGAGIYRDVYLRITEPDYIINNGIYISTEFRGKMAVLHVESEFHTEDGRKVTEIKNPYFLKHELFYCKEENEPEKIELEFVKKDLYKSGEACFCHEAEYLVKAPKRWDVDNPALYTLETSLFRGETLLQKEETRFGFRTISFDSEEGFFLNGRKLKLHGVCEHHDLGALGAAFHRPAMRRRFMKLKDMGVNAIRGAHNMMAEGFMELADEMGLLLISEAFDMWEKPKNAYDYARFFSQWHERDVKSWICRDRNHPSVILWSIGNEIYDTHGDERGQELTGKLKDLVEQYDHKHNAGITLGSNYMPWENAKKCADILKIAGYNYSEKYYEQHHREHPDWVIYGSETSSIVSSRGIYHFPLKAGILSEDDRQCSALGNSITSWGAKSLEACVTVDRDLSFSMGQFLWTGFDYIGEPTPYHTKNSYFGQLDTAGFPKDSYYVWQAAWTDYRIKPMIHLYPYWDFNKGQLIDVRVCSNAPEVELYLNDRSLGRQRLAHEPGSGSRIIADYQIPYEEGAITAVAFDEYGVELARASRTSFGNSDAIILQPENQVIQADGREQLFIEIGTVDRLGRRVENACDRVTVEVRGAGRLVGLDNGDSTDYDSYKGVSRRLFQGKLLGIIQAVTLPGEIQMIVRARGLKEARLTLKSVSPKHSQPVEVREQNIPRPILTGKPEEIPVRKLLLTAPQGQRFTPGQRELTARVQIEPPQAGDRDVIFQAVNDQGAASNLVTFYQRQHEVFMRALGDGSFRLRCLSKSGTEEIRLISQLEFQIEGLGEAYLNPYELISGSAYTSYEGEVGNGNERGVATARDGRTAITYSGIDFGVTGSDEITVPIFALDSGEYPIQIWKGIPEKEGSSLLAEVIYQKPSIWNVYQAETWKLKEALTGIGTISFVLHQKVHIKGFLFAKREKAWMEWPASSADAIYGDSFRREQDRVEEIGNNVSLEFMDMDFGEEGAGKLTICGRAINGKNTIHIRFLDGEHETKQIIEFGQSSHFNRQTFRLAPVKGKVKVTFLFMPGSCFDFHSFQFQR